MIAVDPTLAINYHTTAEQPDLERQSVEIGHNELIRYCETIAAEFEERLERVRALVDEKLRSGTAYSGILRSFLAEHSAGKYGISGGFIVNPFVKDASSNHCDILVYDRIQYPLLDTGGNVKIILPRAAAMAIEVERELTAERLSRSIANIQSARRVYPYVAGVIFSFDGLEPQALYQHMVRMAPTWRSSLSPMAVICLEKGFVAHRSKFTTELGGGNSPYDVYALKHNKSTVALVIFFLLYFNLQMHGMLTAGSLAQACQYVFQNGDAEFLGKLDLT